MIKRILFLILIASLFYCSGKAQMPSQADSNTIFLQHFEENAGTKTNDVSVNNSSGTISGGAVWADGKIGSGIAFDGIDGHVDIGNVSAIDITARPLSITFWIYLPEAVAGHHKVINHTPGNESGYQIRLQASGGFGMIMENSYGYTDSIMVPTDEWVFIAGVWNDAGYVYIYLNGVDSTTSTFGTRPYTGNLAGSNPLYLGRGGAEEYENYILDEVVFHTRTLSPAEIRRIYNRRPTNK